MSTRKNQAIKRYTDENSGNRTRKRHELADVAAHRMGVKSWQILTTQVVGTLEVASSDADVQNGLITLLQSFIDNLERNGKHDRDAEDVQAILKKYPQLKRGRKPNNIGKEG